MHCEGQAIILATAMAIQMDYLYHSFKIGVYVLDIVFPLSMQG